MINEESLRIVENSRLNTHFRKPIYDTYSFAQIPAMVRHLLTGEPGGLPPKALGHFPDRYSKVIVMFVDAFGWRFFEQYHERYPFLQRFVREGVVSKLSTQFPSTTAAHMATIHSGLTVGETGMYEWFFYEPTLDAIISPLVFSFLGDRDRDTLKRAGASPRSIYPRRTFYQDLHPHGITCYNLGNRDYTPSTFSEVMMEGNKIVPFKTMSEGLIDLALLALYEPEPAYFMFYFDQIDAQCHHYGPNSPQFAAEVDTFFTALERLFHANVQGRLDNTLLLMIADHGQVEVHPETTIYLNQLMPDIGQYLKTNLKGELLVPAGSARDMFLHVRPAFLDELQDSLSRKLEGRAEVYRVSDLIEQGYFGPTVSQTFRARVGDLVILPYAHEAVWWYERGKLEQFFQGHHGGLTPAESETILLALPYNVRD